MTSDGISDDDWKQVVERSHALVDASSIDDEVLIQAREQELFEVLDALERKYGPLPSLTATRADFTDETEERQRLLELAYQQAIDRDDRTNLLLVCESLAELMITDLQQKERGAKWLKLMKAYLPPSGDEVRRYQELHRALQDLSE